MSFYFRHFPFLQYDISGSGDLQVAQNPFLRFRLVESLKQKRWTFYDHVIGDGQRAEDIAVGYYGDETLDWVILITNNIVDPKYDWPLDSERFENYIIDKYGSVQIAMSEVSTTNIHHYEWITRVQSRTFDGVIIPEEVLIVDEDTYDNLLISERRVVRNWEYEFNLNESKRRIKVLKSNYLSQYLNEARALIS